MSDIIAFLEQAGRDASMRHASRKALLQLMRKEEIVPSMREALYCKNTVLMPPKMHCKNTVFTPPKIHCKNTVSMPPKKNSPAKTRRVKESLN